MVSSVAERDTPVASGLTSGKRKPSARRSAFLGLVGSVESQLRDAYALQYEAGVLDLQKLADRLGLTRHAVSDRLLGRTVMDLTAVADMAWALGCRIEVRVFPDASTLAETRLGAQPQAKHREAQSIQPTGKLRE